MFTGAENLSHSPNGREHVKKLHEGGRHKEMRLVFPFVGKHQGLSVFPQARSSHNTGAAIKDFYFYLNVGMGQGGMALN